MKSALDHLMTDTTRFLGCGCWLSLCQKCRRRHGRAHGGAHGGALDRRAPRARRSSPRRAPAAPPRAPQAQVRGAPRVGGGSSGRAWRHEGPRGSPRAAAATRALPRRPPAGADRERVGRARPNDRSWGEARGARREARGAVGQKSTRARRARALQKDKTRRTAASLLPRGGGGRGTQRVRWLPTEKSLSRGDEKTCLADKWTRCSCVHFISRRSSRRSRPLCVPCVCVLCSVARPVAL